MYQARGLLLLRKLVSAVSPDGAQVSRAGKHGGASDLQDLRSRGLVRCHGGVSYTVYA